jgi:hypothetical protein
MSPAATRYRLLLTQLVLDRETNPKADEEPAYAELDTLWWAMTDDEQAEIERRLASPEAPESLHLVDALVPLGSSTFPRVDSR